MPKVGNADTLMEMMRRDAWQRIIDFDSGACEAFGIPAAPPEMIAIFERGRDAPGCWPMCEEEV